MKKKKVFSPWWMLVALVFGTILIGLDRTVVNLAVPGIINFFGVSLSTAAWVASVYILANAIFVPIFGKLGGRYGHKKIFLIGFLSFIIISLLAGISWSIGSLIFFRALQGVAGAAIYPSAMSLIAKNFKDKRSRAQALGLWSAMVASSVALGPLIGGPLIDAFSWRSVFFLNFPVGIVGLFMVLSFVPKDFPEEIGKFDYLGAIILGITISSLVLVMDKGLDWGWTSWQSLVLYSIFAMSFILFLFIENKVSNPVVDLKLFKNQTLSSSLITTLVSQGMFTGILLIISLFAQQHLGFTATKAGYIFLPLILGFTILSPLGARLSHRIGPKWAIALGLTVSAVSVYSMSGLNDTTTLFQILLPLVFMGSGLGLGMAPITTAVTSSVPHYEVGVASGLLNLCRNLSGVLGIAILSTLLTAGLSYSSLFILSAFLIFIGAVTALFIRESKEDYEGVDKTKEPNKPIVIK